MDRLVARGQCNRFALCARLHDDARLMYLYVDLYAIRSVTALITDVERAMMTSTSRDVSRGRHKSQGLTVRIE
jgi:hypothetical protein